MIPFYKLWALLGLFLSVSVLCPGAQGKMDHAPFLDHLMGLQVGAGLVLSVKRTAGKGLARGQGQGDKLMCRDVAAGPPLRL